MEFTEKLKIELLWSSHSTIEYSKEMKTLTSVEKIIVPPCLLPITNHYSQ